MDEMSPTPTALRPPPRDSPRPSARPRRRIAATSHARTPRRRVKNAATRSTRATSARTTARPIPRTQVDASLSREMAAMAGGIDALAQRARDIALADERNLEVALHLASAAAAAADEELQLASVAAETGNLDWPEDASTDTGAGSFFIVDGASTKEDDIVASHRERAQLCARSANTIASNLSERLLIDEWSATIAHFAASDWLVDRKKPRVRPKDRRCNQPKARQGWNKRAMRETRVRVCAGCDRMLPTTELIRVARLKRSDEEAEAASKQSPCEPGEQQKQQNEEGEGEGERQEEEEQVDDRVGRWERRGFRRVAPVARRGRIFVPRGGLAPIRSRRRRRAPAQGDDASGARVPATTTPRG